VCDVRLGSRSRRDGDLSSVLAFSLLFLIPAALAALVGIAAWVGRHAWDNTSFLLLPLLPCVVAAAIAGRACTRSGTETSTAWGFAIGAALITGLFTLTVVAGYVVVGD
jgi:hypothetical protein